jgi:hypothetical protein
LRVGSRAAERPAAKRPTARAAARKATSASDCEALEQLPNIGVSLAQDLRLIGIVHPRELSTADPMALYQALCTKTGKRHDPCVLDTFMAVTDFMRGAAPAPWWHYTVRRKALYGQVTGPAPCFVETERAGAGALPG